jgi:DNA-binding transcriptional MerR regulator
VENRALSIGDLAARAGTKVQTIRYYEQIALVPAPERSAGNQRRYGASHLERLAFIRHARELGFSLGAIRELLGLSIVRTSRAPPSISWRECTFWRSSGASPG